MKIAFFLLIFFFSAFLFWIYKNLSLKLNIIDRPDSLNVHKNKTPTGAGIVFLIIYFIGLFLVNYFVKSDISFFDLQKNFIIFIFSIVLISLISFYDDLKNIHPVIRLAIQFTIIFFCTSLFELNTISIPIKLLIFIIIYLWVYIINIINFTDGVDGFLAINSLNFFLLTFFNYQFLNDYNFLYFTSLIISPLLLAYLIFNKPVAKIFMGDCGSIFLGFVIGFVSIKMTLTNHADIVISLLAYTFLDCTITIIKKMLNKNYPWARLFDYYFLKPIKNNVNHKKVFFSNCIYNLTIAIIVSLQIIYGLKQLCLLSIFFALILMLYFNSFSTYKKNNLCDR
jgi:UDP-N-acetylmuramyl pentapeptide phosphotransferase/UDP-N-acetylglucosamine-1-phosphate transferase